MEPLAQMVGMEPLEVVGDTIISGLITLPGGGGGGCGSYSWGTGGDGGRGGGGIVIIRW